MRFKDVEKAREFYNRYARHAGFGIRKTGGNDKYFVCAFQGVHTSSVSEPNRKQNKTAKQDQDRNTSTTTSSKKDANKIEAIFSPPSSS